MIWQGGLAMRTFICTILIYLMMAASCVQANGLNLEVSMGDDSHLAGRLWYDNQLIWSIVFAGKDYAQPAVANQSDGKTVIITPEIESGFFVFKLH